ncbi:MAG: hypothetical protein ACTHMO_03625 [Rhodanobacteraceae bacterium]
MLKAFRFDEDLYAAETEEQARACWKEDTGEEYAEEVQELDDAELDAPQPEFDENENQTGGTTSVRQMLAEHGDEPGWLAGGNW